MMTDQRVVFYNSSGSRFDSSTVSQWKSKESQCKGMILSNRGANFWCANHQVPTETNAGGLNDQRKRIAEWTDCQFSRRRWKECLQMRFDSFVAGIGGSIVPSVSAGVSYGRRKSTNGCLRGRRKPFAWQTPNFI